MLLSVVIVNFNGARFLQDALDTVLASQLSEPFEVIVVDNQSHDHSKSILDAYTDRVSVLYNDDNKGFSAANNQGVSLAKGEFVFLLNNDTRTDALACGYLIDALKDNPRIGAVGPKLLNADGSLQLPGGILGQRQYKTDQASRVSFLSGAALMMRRDVYRSLGGFDDAFFFYNEDLDLCKRIQKAGYSLCFLPNAEVVHLGGQSTQFLRKKALVEGYRGGLYFCYKHYGLLPYILYRLVLVPLLLLLIVFYAITGWSAMRREQMAAFCEILFRVVVKGYQ
jgi:GT2 family glycosyltransferase